MWNVGKNVNWNKISFIMTIKNGKGQPSLLNWNDRLQGTFPQMFFFGWFGELAVYCQNYECHSLINCGDLERHKISSVNFVNIFIWSLAVRFCVKFAFLFNFSQSHRFLRFNDPNNLAKNSTNSNSRSKTTEILSFLHLFARQ